MFSRKLILISGPIAVGKSCLAEELVNKHGFMKIRSSPHLVEKAKKLGLPITRENLQYLGDSLDIETEYSWVIDSVAIPEIQKAPNHTRWLFDSVRKKQQIELFKTNFSTSEVFHIHLTAEEHILKTRYISRASSSDIIDYTEVCEHQNEISARSLIEFADLVIDVGEEASSDVIAELLQKTS